MASAWGTAYVLDETSRRSDYAWPNPLLLAKIHQVVLLFMRLNVREGGEIWPINAIPGKSNL